MLPVQALDTGEAVRTSARCAPRHLLWLSVALLLTLLIPAAGRTQPARSQPAPPDRKVERSAEAARLRWSCDLNDGHGVGKILVPTGGWGGGFSGYAWTCYSTIDERAGEIEYPFHSGQRYLPWLDLWIGGVRDGDTLVTTTLNWTGTGGWSEFTPLPEPEGCVVVRTSRPELVRGIYCDKLLHDDSARSEEDIIVRSGDTSLEFSRNSDPVDHRAHTPLGVTVTQRSYAWSPGYAEDFVLAEIEVRNVARRTDGEPETVKAVYLALEGIAWVTEGSQPTEWWDDFVGYLPVAASPSYPGINQYFDLFWVADNNGDPFEGRFDRSSIPNAVGVSLLKLPVPRNRIAFNWWTDWEDREDGWGPVRRNSRVQFPYSGMGYPFGDKAKYQMMSNGEIDYPQYEIAIDHSQFGWLPPPDPALAADIADGFGVSYLASFGPLDLSPDSAVTLAIAIVGGENFHHDPAHFATFDPQNPSIWKSGLDFSDLLRNAEWAQWIYDNPGVDTDGDGYAGEYFLRGRDTVYYRGDGVADLNAGLPPSPPAPDFEIRAGQVRIHWNGQASETEADVFTRRADFEGYRLYMSRTGQTTDWSLLTQRDLLNYGRHTWNPTHGRWEMQDPPFTLDSLKALYDAYTIDRYGFPFQLDSFKVAEFGRAFLEIVYDPDIPDRVDSIYRYFAPYEANNTPDDRSLAAAAAAGIPVTGVIRKLYPEASPGDRAQDEDGTWFAPYYDYEYVIDGLQVAEPIFFALTVFDNGDPANGLPPLESSMKITAQEMWPVNSAGVVAAERPKPGVYPNPYRIVDNYYDLGWENRRGLEPDRERARKLTFFNVPDTCTVSIWSLDGDLVRKLEHRADPAGSDATVVTWNLITRNTQAVKTGIYIWSVESRFGTDVGKLVIIK